jgi:hypothetical protein
MNKRQQLEKLGNELNETFKQYVELAIQVEIEEKIERTLNELFDNLEKIINDEEIVDGQTAKQPEPSIIDMLMRYNNFLKEVETFVDEDDEDAEDDEEYEEEIIDVSEKEFKDFLQLLKKIEVLKQ